VALFEAGALARRNGTTAEGYIWMAGSLARMARVLGRSCPMELAGRTEQDQGLGAWIQERTDRPLVPSVDVADGSRAGWTSGIPRDTCSRAGNDSAGGCRGAWRQALGGSEALSFIR
jgi:hypothetical protein